MRGERMEGVRACARDVQISRTHAEVARHVRKLRGRSAGRVRMRGDVFGWCAGDMRGGGRDASPGWGSIAFGCSESNARLGILPCILRCINFMGGGWVGGWGHW